MLHEHGIYSNNDAIPMLYSFLDIVSTIGSNSILQINYEHDKLQLILNNNFEPTQFSSYTNILQTKQIQATIEDYKTYSHNLKSSKSADTNNPSADAQAQTFDDGAWVITLQYSMTLTSNGSI